MDSKVSISRQFLNEKGLKFKTIHTIQLSNAHDRFYTDFYKLPVRPIMDNQWRDAHDAQITYFYIVG